MVQTTLKLTISLTVQDDEPPSRLDTYLASCAEKAGEETRLRGLTRSAIKNLIKDGLIVVDGQSSRASHKVRPGEVVTLTMPEDEPPAVTPEAIPLEILFEDPDVIVVVKPRGMVVHPGAGVTTGTLVSALLHHTNNLSTIGSPLRPGIVHRLDKDTSGVLVVARSDTAHLALAKEFKDHTTLRRYRALVWGVLKVEAGTIEVPIGRDKSNRKKISKRSTRPRRAVTHFRVLARYPYLTLVELTLETGRTHQVRVHLSEAGHPVVGDPVYGKRTVPPVIKKPVADLIKSIKGQLLHAETLGFTHPRTGEVMEFHAPPPPEMAEILKLLEEDQREPLLK